MFEHLQINIGLLLFSDRFDNIPTIVNRTMLLSLTYIHDLIKNNGPRKTRVGNCFRGSTKYRISLNNVLP